MALPWQVERVLGVCMERRRDSSVSNPSQTAPRDVIAKSLSRWGGPEDGDRMEADKVIAALQDGGYVIVKDMCHE